MGRKWEEQMTAGDAVAAETGSNEATFPPPAHFADIRGAASETWIRALAGEWSERWSRSHGSATPPFPNSTLAG